jgi:hypothetical protein
MAHCFNWVWALAANVTPWPDGDASSCPPFGSHRLYNVPNRTARSNLTALNHLGVWGLLWGPYINFGITQYREQGSELGEESSIFRCQVICRNTSPICEP